MQLPKSTAAYSRHIRFARYVASKLTASRYTELAADVTAGRELVREQGRAWEDLSEAKSERMAERDAADEALDTVARRFRLDIASRSVNATKEAPYRAIFPEGMTYYTAAPITKNAARYRELVARAEKNLAAGDETLAALADTLPPLIEAHTRSRVALADAHTAAGISRTSLEATLDDWARQMERTYAALVGEVGRRDAERFFPSARTSSRSATGELALNEDAPETDEL